MMSNLDVYVSLATQTVLSPRGNMLARICIVDHRGDILLDSLVLPTDEAIDYHTARTGFEASYFVPSHGAVPFEDVRYQAQQLLNNKIVVAYELWRSLDALRLFHRADQTRDLATYIPMQTTIAEGGDGFRNLMKRFMNRSIRDGLENAVEDARAAIDLYRSCRKDWEGVISSSVWPCLLPPKQFQRWYQ